jgi:hypothetical protein
MASKKRGGEVVNLTVSILRSIRDELRELNERVDQRFGALEQRLGALESTTARGFEAVTVRLENIRDFSGERWRDHERRIRRLEARAAPR